MLGRPQQIALALIVAGLACLNTGCTSNRLLKSNGFGWLGSNQDDTNLQRDNSAFPPPSSVEVPQSVSNQRGASAATRNIANNLRTNGNPMRPNNTGAAPNTQMRNAFAQNTNQNHPMVQSGLYDVPTTPPIGTAPAIPPAATPAATGLLANQNTQSNSSNSGSIYGNSPGVPLTQSNVQPADNAAIHASATSPVNNRQRSIYESPANRPRQNQALAPLGYEAPIDLPAAGYTVATASATAPVASAPAAEVVAPSAPVPTQPAFYQARATQPRPWRPGSTTDLKTL